MEQGFDDGSQRQPEFQYTNGSSFNNESNDYTHMNLRVPALVFFILGIVFVLFSRQVTAAFHCLDKNYWDEAARNRFPHLAPVGDPPRSAALVLDISWIVCAIIFWFI